MCSNCRGGGGKRTVRLRANDNVAVVLGRLFPGRVEVSGVEINVSGLARGDLENEGLSEREIVWILAHS